jgi:ABC-type proline/glycine betaine transport system permease subunit
MALVLVLVLIGIPFAVSALLSLWLRRPPAGLSRKWRVALASIMAGIVLEIMAAYWWPRDREAALGILIMAMMQVLIVGLPTALWLSRDKSLPAVSAEVFD